MALSNKIKEKIALEVIKTLFTRFDNFPENATNNRNAPFHEAFLSAFSAKLEKNVSNIPFFISLSSWMHGLNTTLGQTFFENIAHHISQGKKREYTSKRSGNLLISQQQRDDTSKIIADLSNSTADPDLILEDKLLFKNSNSNIIDAMDFSADVFIEDSHSITAIELKSVKPNSGEMKGEKQKILEGKAALYREFSGKEIHFYIGFPFDPTVDLANDKNTSYDKKRFLAQIINMTKFFDPKETLVASELWDMLSGCSNTMEQILEIINIISTADFLDKYRYLNENTNRNEKQYQDILRDWFLISELEIVENQQEIQDGIIGNKALERLFNNTMFKKEKYRMDRYAELTKYISKKIIKA